MSSSLATRVATPVDNDLPLIEDLRARWLRGDGAGIEEILLRLFRCGAHENINLEKGARALAMRLGFDVSAAPKSKRRRTDAAQLVFSKEKGEAPVRSSFDFASTLQLAKYAQIQTLDMTSYDNIALKPTQVAFDALGNLTQLRRVLLPNLVPHNTSSWSGLTGGLPRVEEAWLNEGALYDDALVSVFNFMRELRRLRIDLGTGDWRARREAIPADTLPHLKHLFLRGGGEFNGQVWSKYNSTGELRDRDVGNIISKAPCLEALDVSFNFHLADVAAQAIGQHPSLTSVRWQHFGHSSSVAALTPRFQQSGTLARVDLSFLAANPQGLSIEISGIAADLPRISFVAERKPSRQALQGFLPVGWPACESLWDTETQGA